MTKTPKKSAPYVESIYIRNEGPKTLAILGRFEGEDHAIVLARVGEGKHETRSDDVLKITAEAFIDVLHEGHRNAWLRDAGLENTMGYLSIDYTETDPDPATSYRGVTVSVRRPSFNAVEHTFFTGDPEADMAAAMQKISRSCAQSLSSSSVDNFVGDVAGFRWDETNRLVVDTNPKNTVEAMRKRWK